MNVVEIIFGRKGAGPLRVQPRPAGVTLVPIDLPETTAAEVARAVRQTLGSARRTAATTTLPLVQVTLEDAGTRWTVVDDASRQIRGLKESRDGQARAIEADTSSLADDLRLEAILGRVASALSIEVTEDLAPALAWGVSAQSDPSPKELAYQRAHDRARALAIEVRALDRQMHGPRMPGANWAIGALVAFVLLVGASMLLEADARRVAVPGLSLALIGVLLVFATKSWRRLAGQSSLEATRTRKAQEREAARREAREIGETLVKKGADPDEVAGRLSKRTPPPGVPALIHRGAMSTADVTALGDLHRQVIVFIDRPALLFADDYGDAVRRPAAPVR